MPSLSEHLRRITRKFFLTGRLLACLSLLPAVFVAEAGTLSIVGQSRWVEVAHVYDGDTFRTSQGEKVRLLGINTPEIAHNDNPGEPMGNKAKKRLQQLIGGQLVELRMDREKRDTYGRTLAQAYLRNGSWINGLLAREGYAFVYTFAPNFGWVKALLKEEAAARSRELGIWKTGRFRSLSSRRVTSEHIGQFRLVTGSVSSLREWSFNLDGLMISVPKKFRHWFKDGLEIKDGQNITVRGSIRLSRGGKLYLALHSPYDIE